jgi:hypothetical protein
MRGKKYPDSTRDVVVTAVLTHEMSRRAAAKRFHVPLSTVRRWVDARRDQQRGELRVLEALPKGPLNVSQGTEGSLSLAVFPARGFPRLSSRSCRNLSRLLFTSFLRSVWCRPDGVHSLDAITKVVRNRVDWLVSRNPPTWHQIRPIPSGNFVCHHESR